MKFLPETGERLKNYPRTRLHSIRAAPVSAETGSHQKKLEGVIVNGVGVEVHLYPKFQKCTYLKTDDIS